LRGTREGDRPIAPAALGSAVIHGVTQDSRAVVAGSLFVAIPGAHVDGHDYVATAAAAGAAAALVERPLPGVRLPLAIVERGQRALATAAAWSWGDPSQSIGVIGIPPGVLNIVASSDHLTGEILSTDPRVDVVSFTGSTATGRRIMECAAPTVKKVFLELGGKSANILLDDADIPAIVPSGAMTCVHGGQGCAITTRMLLPRSRYDEGVALLKAAFENWNYGDPTQPQNLQGPQISKRQQARVLEYIEKGKQEGAKLLVGGGKPDGKGCFVEPTLFVDVDPKSTIAQEEIFGPVLVVIPYEDDDDAVRIANDSMYGLSGAVHSANLDRALSVARRIRTGTLSVNGHMWFHVDSPFGGYKQSGLGRENGQMGFEEYLETKVIAVPPTGS
jgi:aldehyde dehydrogenase (NAD+)